MLNINFLSLNNYNAMCVIVYVGQILFVEVIERNEPPKIIECEIVKIGRKYAYIKKDWQEIAINKLNLKYESKFGASSDFQAYLNKQDILDKQEKGRLTRILRNHCDWYGKIKNNTLDEIKQVCQILGVS